MSSQQNKKGKEQSFHILPHPAKTNNPADLQPEQREQLRSDPVQAFHARDPYVPDPKILENLPPATSREELQKRQDEINRRQADGR
ncbi:hypothetical protein FA15DRAFT_670576 [Coprinopsis marcescibilis]|uniref:Uncharacterized protein n=1 Tax=Coprinopsis marcescibilis TaxID=230819 RepID=A0A5C3KTX0_COPMA|nr:hypothetical protein FA15DRAFT_670576 [Coprinopsis marcescibilis]